MDNNARTKLTKDWDEWIEAKRLLQNELMEVSFTTWIEPLLPVYLEGEHLSFEVTSEFNKGFLNSKYKSVIENALSQISGRGYEVMFVLKDDHKSGKQKKPVNLNIDPLFLNPRYTFDTFVIGNSNSFAHAASLAVAEEPAKAYNPLFIYGESGLGKTHLLHAIGHFILTGDRNKKIVYVSLEKFMNELISSIQANSVESFRHKYRSADVLMIDDIHFISNKESTQDELFHTFNALYETDKQIVFTSDKPPKTIDSLEDRLLTRFSWGLITDIQPPDFETRIAIMTKKLHSNNIYNVDYEVLEFIAMHNENNIRELEGALTKVLAYSKLNNLPITLDNTKEALKDLISSKTERKITAEGITERICEKFNLTETEIKSRRKSRDISYPRQIAMYLTRELTEMSLPAIGKFFGGRDHTTVLHGWKTISTEMAKNNELRILLSDIRSDLSDNR